MATQSPALNAPTVSISHGQATTTSKAVADYFHKNHRDVLRKIDALLPDLPAEFHQRNFSPMELEVDIGLGKTRRDPAYELTRDGFTLLAMGFTGKKALQWKLRYIEVFNAMEAQLREQSSLPTGYVAVDKTSLEQLRRHLVDWKKSTYRLYGPLSDLGVKEANALHCYAQEVSLVWGLATRTEFSNGKPHRSSARASVNLQPASAQHQVQARPAPELSAPAGQVPVFIPLYHDSEMLVTQIGEWLMRHGVRQTSAYDVAELALGLSEGAITDAVLQCIGWVLERLGWRLGRTGKYVFGVV